MSSTKPRVYHVLNKDMYKWLHPWRDSTSRKGILGKEAFHLFIHSFKNISYHQLYSKQLLSPADKTRIKYSVYTQEGHCLVQQACFNRSLQVTWDNARRLNTEHMAAPNHLWGSQQKQRELAGHDGGKSYQASQKHEHIWETAWWARSTEHRKEEWERRN